ncbi:Trk system potassium uptake protein TrkA [Liquorilactobacillus sucicola DSM 21376 = JCM 15457]|uniref:Trk family K+ transporter n=1 Tax=Liquorilactobacillus sucicola DSM 21376 = JCM 15457 TaxID=1423806 RepID=A0A023CUR8_9LACO|nr:TrkA family potassium uptake protein [Liquorilactobacillus sucicola]KRN05199.1 Trk family K+ transporter [Liquorilactobacillus sucicola DSM 21376 = JCM 15457]GAJ25255.1 Trk system potassium uptake protein TrkA [Liquorilactobacillus sucicola DSM 21376 = JCM 15457]
MTKQNFAIIGLGRFGGSICQTLISAGAEVLVIDKDEARINDYKNIATQAVIADAQDENTLKALGIRNFDHVVIAIGEDIQASILVTLMVKELGVKYVTAKAQNEYHARVLTKLGVDKVVHPERDMGVRIGRNLISKNMLDYLDLSSDIKVAEIRITSKKFVDKSLEALNFRSKYALNVIAIRREKKVEIAPQATMALELGDSLLVVGRKKDVDNFDKLMEQ